MKVSRRRRLSYMCLAGGSWTTAINYLTAGDTFGWCCSYEIFHCRSSVSQALLSKGSCFWIFFLRFWGLLFGRSNWASKNYLLFNPMLMKFTCYQLTKPSIYNSKLNVCMSVCPCDYSKRLLVRKSFSVVQWTPLGLGCAFKKLGP